MSRVVITGAAGFIGSSLVDAALARGDDVVGIDCFTPYYDRDAKAANLSTARAHPSFTFVEADLLDAQLEGLLEGAEVVFHQAAQPGVRLSWSDGFETYANLNVVATQRLLEAATRTGVPRVVYASSSSVYGQAPRYPTVETDLPHPHSPYGVTKLAAEHLCGLYAANWGLSTVSLRYFTVYGPRQRPDMAIHRILRAGLAGTAFPLFGDGSALRDFTFVGDVVAANLAAADADVAPGTVVNIAGGGEISVADLLALAGDVLGVPIPVEQRDPQPGDVDRTGGDVGAAARLLGWSPEVSLRQGLEAQAAWHRRTAAASPPVG